MSLEIWHPTLVQLLSKRLEREKNNENQKERFWKRSSG